MTIIRIKRSKQTKSNINEIKFKTASCNAKLLYEYSSEALSSLLKKMLKESNNVYAESFF
jgi:D-alanyl-D-alanine carboxypeptidase